MSCQQPSILRHSVVSKSRSDLVQHETVLSISTDKSISQGFHIQAAFRTSLRTHKKQRKCFDSGTRKYDVLMAYQLPRDCYLDPLELENYRLNLQVNGVQPSPSLPIRVHTHKATVDTEVIAEEAEETVYALEVLGVDAICYEGDYGSLNISYNLPLHVRYHRPRANGSTVTFRVEPPALLSRNALDKDEFMRRSHESRQVVVHRVYDITHLGNSGNSIDTHGPSGNPYSFVGSSKEDYDRSKMGFDISVPIGNSDYATRVSCVTTLTALLTMIIILRAIMKT